MSNAFGAKPPVGGVDIAVPHSDGRWINQRVSRIVEIIKDLDPDIDVQWVPPENREFGDPAFRLMHKQVDGTPYVIFYVQNEEEFDERVIARLRSIDARTNPLSLAALDAQNDAIKLVQAKKAMEEMEEAHDLSQHILRSPKTRYRHDGVVYE